MFATQHRMQSCIVAQTLACQTDHNFGAKSSKTESRPKPPPKPLREPPDPATTTTTILGRRSTGVNRSMRQFRHRHLMLYCNRNG